MGFDKASKQAAAGTENHRDFIEEALAKDFGSISQVADVFIQRDGNTLKVWIGLEDFSDEVRYRLYDKELAEMDAFPSVQFDFNLLVTMGRPVTDFTSEPGHFAFRRRKR